MAPARIVALVPDLLFGSQVLAMLRGAGHEVVLVNGLDQVEPDAVDLLVVDLTAEAPERIAAAGGLAGVKRVAFYSHVEAEVGAAAQAAGFDLVVPRSRFAREGAQLVERVLRD